MKKKSKVLVILLLLVVVIACKKDNAVSKVKKENVEAAIVRDAVINQDAKISFDKTEYDFGTVNEGDIVEATFILTNTGKLDLVITDAKATCGCTVPTWPKEAVKPGDVAEVKVEFNTKGKPNQQSKTVTLSTNTENGRERVTIKGMVIPKKKN